MSTWTNRMGKEFTIEPSEPHGWVRLSREYKVGDKAGTYSVLVKADDVIAWEAGEFIQNVMPYLNADEREFLISGYSPVEYEALFGEYE